MIRNTKKTWQEKLADHKGLPKVITLTAKQSSRWGTGTMVIPAPLEVDALMQKVPKGKVTTTKHLREDLARQHETNSCCPITTGIFSWIAAHAAVEAQAAGKKRITPWWRTLKANGELNPKYPGGLAEQSRLLQAEGHEILPGKGKKPPYIKDFVKALVKTKEAPKKI